MVTKPLLSDFIKYTSANILSMIGLSCYILADTYFIASELGANGLASLNLAIPMYSFIYGCGLMLGIGGATKYAITKSQGKPDDANRVFTNTIRAAFCVIAVFVVGGLFFSGTITRLFQADEAVFQMTQIYLKVIMLCAPLFIFNSIIIGFIRNDGAPGTAMTAMLCGTMSNIILDYIGSTPKTVDDKQKKLKSTRTPNNL
jgi:Na+-driven multidrug efflux pump